MSSIVDSYGTLLAAMMTTAGIVWTVGFAAYEFIFRYMDRWAHDPEQVAARLDPAGDLARNERVFRWFMIDGILSFGAVVSAAAVYLTGAIVTLVVASGLFLAALVLFLWLLTHEIHTTLIHVQRDRDRILKSIGKSGPDVAAPPPETPGVGSQVSTRPRGRKEFLARRLLAYGFLIGMYIVFGVEGGSGSGWVNTLQLGISAGSIAGFMVLFVQTEVLRT